jgi:hypothetical protein
MFSIGGNDCGITIINGGAMFQRYPTETNSLFKEYLICSYSPSKRIFHDGIDVLNGCFFSYWIKTTKEPLGTGTRIAFEVIFPSNDGNAFFAASPAPVSVIVFKAAALRRYFVHIIHKILVVCIRMDGLKCR